MPHGADTQHGTKRIMKKLNVILLALFLVLFKHFKTLFFILKNYFYPRCLLYNYCMFHRLSLSSVHWSFLLPQFILSCLCDTSGAYWVLTACFRHTEPKLCQFWVWVHISALASTFKWQWSLQLNWKQGCSEGVFFPPYTLTGSNKSLMQSWKFLLVS